MPETKLSVADLCRSRAISANLLGPTVVFNPSSFCTCADNTPVTCQPNPTPCAMKTDKRVLIYVAVSGSQTYTPLISRAWSLPGSVNARTVLRTQ